MAFLPLAAGVLGASMLIPRLITRLPARALLAGGLLLAAAGMRWLTQIGVNSAYATNVLPALLAVGLGMGTVAPIAVNLATLGVADHDSGAASAVLNTSQQVGASLGVALLNTIAANRTADYLAAHQLSPELRLAAQVDGYTLATAWGAVILVAAVIGTLALVKINLTSSAQASPAETGAEQ